MPSRQKIVHIPLNGSPGLFGGNNPAIPANALITDNSKDADFSSGSARRIGGYVMFTSTFPTSSDVEGPIIQGHDWNPTATAPYTVLLTPTGQVAKESTASSGTFIQVASGVVATSAFFVDGGKEEADNNKKLFLFTGANSVRVMDGNATSMATVSFPPAEWDGTSQPSYGYVHIGRMWAGGAANDPHRVFYSTEKDHEQFTNSVLTESIRFTGSVVAFKNADLTTNADAKVGTISFWIRFVDGSDYSGADVGDDMNQIIFISSSTPSSIGFRVRRGSNNKIIVNGWNAAGTQILLMQSLHSWTKKDGWIHVNASWDLAQTIGYLYINGVDDLNSENTTFTDDTIEYTKGFHQVGATEDGVSPLSARLAQVYINFAEFVDLSIATRRKAFYDKGVVELGSDGSDPTGNDPIVFLDNPLASWHTNLGYGGNFTVGVLPTFGATSLTSNRNVPPGGLDGDPGSFAIAPSIGLGLVAGASYKGFAVHFKGPRGIYITNTNDVDITNWQTQVLSDNIGIAGARAWCITENELLFMGNDGDIHALSILQEQSQHSASITRLTQFHLWIRQYVDLAKISNTIAQYYPDKKWAMFAVYPKDSSGGGGRRFIVCDFNYPQPRFFVLNDNTGISPVSSFWMRRDGDGILRPAIGTTSFIDPPTYGFFPSATTNGATGTFTTVLPALSLRIPNSDFGYVDPELANIRKNGRWLEVIYEPATGSVTLAAEIFWDGNSYATITFALPASTGIGYVRRRLVGAGRTFGTRLYHPTPSTTTHNFALNGLNVYFVPGASSPT